MTPESLITVTSFGTPELAAEDVRKLREAGLNPYLGGEYYRHHEPVELRVPESELEKALAVLELDSVKSLEDQSRPSPALAFMCPECRTADTYRIPPYALYVLVVSVALLLISLLLRQAGFGIAAVMVGWVLAMWLSRRSGRYRCRNCKHEWKPE